LPHRDVGHYRLRVFGALVGWHDGVCCERLNRVLLEILKGQSLAISAIRSGLLFPFVGTIPLC
jgi:hypothetical protein